MGIVTLNLAKIGEGLHHRLQRLNTNELVGVARALGVSLTDAPKTDVLEWMRQRILDDLAGGSYGRGGIVLMDPADGSIVEPPPELHHFRPASIDTREPKP